MLFLFKLNLEFSSYLLKEAKANFALSLFLLAAKKTAIIASFRWDSLVLTAARTADAADVYKEAFVYKTNYTSVQFYNRGLVLTGF